MEFNKIAAAVLLAGLIGMITGKISTTLYYGAAEVHGEAAEKRSYSIAGADEEGAASGGAAEKEIANIAALLQTADAQAGGVFFSKKCTTCHSGDKGGADKTGPHLWGVHNRPIGSVAGFGYSKAMASFGGNWDYDALNHFLLKPKKHISGTIMAYPGIEKDQDRANVVAYLRTLSDSPAALPAAPAPGPEPAAKEKSVEEAPKADETDKEKTGQ